MSNAAMFASGQSKSVTNNRSAVLHTSRSTLVHTSKLPSAQVRASHPNALPTDSARATRNHEAIAFNTSMQSGTQPRFHPDIYDTMADVAFEHPDASPRTAVAADQHKVRSVTDEPNGMHTPVLRPDTTTHHTLQATTLSRLGLLTPSPFPSLEPLHAKQTGCAHPRGVHTYTPSSNMHQPSSTRPPRHKHAATPSNVHTLTTNAAAYPPHTTLTDVTARTPVRHIDHSEPSTTISPGYGERHPPQPPLTISALLATATVQPPPAQRGLGLHAMQRTPVHRGVSIPGAHVVPSTPAARIASGSAALLTPTGTRIREFPPVVDAVTPVDLQQAMVDQRAAHRNLLSTLPRQVTTPQSLSPTQKRPRASKDHLSKRLHALKVCSSHDS